MLPAGRVVCRLATQALLRQGKNVQLYSATIPFALGAILQGLYH